MWFYGNLETESLKVIAYIYLCDKSDRRNKVIKI